MPQYTQAHHVADEISRWVNLGVDLPEDLEKALEVYETLRYVEVGHRPQFDLSTVTADNAEAKIRAYAEHLALAGDGNGFSMLEKAKKAAVDDAARRVANLAGGAVSSVIEQLTPAFEGHADAYAEAVSKLPTDITAESLVAGGADAVAVYGQAQQEAAHLNAVSNWAGSLTSLPFGGTHFDPVLTILHPESVLDLIKLDEVNLKQADPTVVPLNAVWVAAVRLGVPFGINTPRAATKLRKELEGQGRSQARPQNVTYSH